MDTISTICCSIADHFLFPYRSRDDERDQKLPSSSVTAAPPAALPTPPVPMAGFTLPKPTLQMNPFTGNYSIILLEFLQVVSYYCHLNTDIFL